MVSYLWNSINYHCISSLRISHHTEMDLLSERSSHSFDFKILCLEASIQCSLIDFAAILFVPCCKIEDVIILKCVSPVN